MVKISAPLSVVILASLIAASHPPAAQAQTAQTLTGLYACESISEPMEQLACFKRETALLRAGESSGEFVTIDKQAVKEIEKESFGFNIPKLNIFNKKEGEKKSETPKQHAFAIKRTSKTAKGYVRFYLENGQIWDQTESGYVGRLGKKDPDMIVIKSGAFGSFRARVNEKGPRIKVRRVE